MSCEQWGAMEGYNRRVMLGRSVLQETWTVALACSSAPSLGLMASSVKGGHTKRSARASLASGF